MQSLSEYIAESKALHQNVNIEEKLIVNKDYKAVSNVFGEIIKITISLDGWNKTDKESISNCFKEWGIDNIIKYNIKTVNVNVIYDTNRDGSLDIEIQINDKKYNASFIEDNNNSGMYTVSKTNINIKSFKNAEIWDEWIISEMISTILKKYYK